MHPFRYALTRGPMVMHAIDDDGGGEDLDLDLEQDEVEEAEEDDEPEEDPDADPYAEDDADPEPPARQPSRGENRIATLAREKKAAEDKAALYERQLAELSARQNQPPQPTQEQINAHLATLEPWERTEFLRQQDSQRFEATLRNMQFQQQESADKTAYEALKLRSPIAAKLESDVEQRLAQMRASGTTAPRETVLRWVIGDRALANAGRATGKAKKAAATNREYQTARPSNSRGDAAQTDRRANTTSARNKRLENMNI